MRKWFSKAFRRPPEQTILYREGARGAYSSGSNERIYRDCPAVNKAVDLLATGIAQMDLECEIEFDTLLLEQSRYEFIYELVEQMLVFGFGVIRVKRFDDTLHPRSVSVLTQGVEVEFEDQRVRVKDGNRYLRPSEYIFVPDTTSAWSYESRVSRVAPVANALIAAHRYVNAEFDKGQGAIFALKSPDNVMPATADRQFATLREALDHIRGRGGMVLDMGQSLERLSIADPANADIRHLVDQLVRQIAAFFGLPPNLLGTEDAKYNNSTAHVVSMHRESFAPLADRISARLSHGLDCMLRLSVESLLRGDIQAQVRLAVEATGGAVLTHNEGRQLFLGLPPVSRRELNGSMLVDTRDRRGEQSTDRGNIVEMPTHSHQDL